MALDKISLDGINVSNTTRNNVPKFLLSIFGSTRHMSRFTALRDDEVFFSCLVFKIVFVFCDMLTFLKKTVSK